MLRQSYFRPMGRNVFRSTDLLRPIRCEKREKLRTKGEKRVLSTPLYGPPCALLVHSAEAAVLTASEGFVIRRLSFSFGHPAEISEEKCRGALRQGKEFSVAVLVSPLGKTVTNVEASLQEASRVILRCVAMCVRGSMVGHPQILPSMGPVTPCPSVEEDSTILSVGDWQRFHRAEVSVVEEESSEASPLQSLVLLLPWAPKYTVDVYREPEGFWVGFNPSAVHRESHSHMTDEEPEGYWHTHHRMPYFDHKGCVVLVDHVVR